MLCRKSERKKKGKYFSIGGKKLSESHFLISSLVIFRRVRKIAKSHYSLLYTYLSVFPSVRMKQLNSHWTDFCKTRYLSILQKSVDKVDVSLKPDQNNGCFT